MHKGMASRGVDQVREQELGVFLNGCGTEKAARVHVDFRCQREVQEVRGHGCRKLGK